MNGKYFCDENPMLRDYGPEPLIINIDRFAKMNPDYRTALLDRRAFAGNADEHTDGRRYRP